MSSSRQAISNSKAATVGPYSQAVRTGNLLYLSGQTPLDPATGKLIEGDIGAQTGQCFKNLFAVLEAVGLSQDKVIKVNVFLTNMADFGAMNEVYARQFETPYPARTTIGVAALPLGAQVEIELIAESS